MLYRGIISIAGGGAGTSLGSGVSGILSINSQTGPHVNLTSVDNTIDISAAANVIDLSCSGFVSGIQFVLINNLGGRIETSGQILLQAINNINCTTKYFGFFTNMISGTFTHGLNTSFINYNVYASGVTIYTILPDDFILDDANNVTLLFKIPQTGFMVITG